jgi:hypothetical protein
MPKRISKTHHEYARQALAPGDEFEAEAKHLPMLLALGRIEPEPGEAGYVAGAESARVSEVVPRVAGAKARTKQIIHRADA